VTRRGSPPPNESSQTWGRGVSVLPAVTGNVARPGSGFLYLNDHLVLEGELLDPTELGGDPPEPVSHMDLAGRLEQPQRAQALICWNINIAASNPEQARLHLESQLQQSRRLESIGRVAGGVAHDFNNLLTVIAGYAELLEDPQPTGTDTVLAAREIGAAAERAAGLTRQLLALSRRQLAKPMTVDLNEVVRGLEPVLRRTLPESIQVELVLDPALPPVQADPSQLDQVLLNLALNARDAMPSRGRLRIETLWIAPVMILAAVGLSLAQEGMPSPLGLAVDIAALAAGAFLGWWRARFTQISIDPANHQLTSRASPVVKAIRRQGCDVWRWRPKVSSAKKLWLLAACWWNAPKFLRKEAPR
jgi:hypothetical protein